MGSGEMMAPDSADCSLVRCRGLCKLDVLVSYCWVFNHVEAILVCHDREDKNRMYQSSIPRT
jgi:hypothetical protein